MSEKIEDTKGYKTAFKSTAIFGGSQFFTILIGVVRSKLIAIWLGTYGMGIIGVFNTAVGLVSNVSNLGLQSSAVRDIARHCHDAEKLSIVTTALNRLVIITGIIGTIIMALFSSKLSDLYFGNNEFALPLAVLSVVVLVNGLTQQKCALLQGTRKLKWIVKVNIFSALFSLIASIPIIYFFRVNGIVPVLIVTALITYCFSLFYSKKICLKKINQSFRETLNVGKNTITLGIVLSITGVLASVTEFIIRSFIANKGTLSDVGLYTAGWAINASYLGLVFTAMSKDYFPRLAQYSENNKEMSKMANEQVEIALLILAPMIVLMIVFVQTIIDILYSNEFYEAISMTKWLLFGSLIKSASWGLSYIVVAKGASKIFLILEVSIMLISLPLYLSLYNYCGLLGIGVAFSISYFIYFFMTSFVAYKEYKIYYDSSFYKIFLILTLMIGSLLFVGSNQLQVLINIIISLLVLVYSLYEFNKRLPIIGLINAIKNKRK